MTKESNSQSNLVESKLLQVGNYKFTGKVLGKGSFANVREAVHVKLRSHVSVKIIDLRKCNPYMLKHYLREASILKNLDHPYIMKLFETMKYNNMYYMVTELIQGGDLCAYVQQKKGKVDESITRRFSRQIASALRYLHSRGIVHRDLKLENVMLDSTKRNIKLIDFGLTNNWSIDSPLKTLCGSPEYSAPELFVPGNVYGPEVDMWAFGVIMFAMAVGKLPFPCLSSIMKTPEKKSLFLKTINNGLPDDIIDFIKGYSLHFTELIKGLMNPNGKERLTIKDVIKDPWMTNNGHWVEAAHDILSSFDVKRIMQQLSSKLKTTPAKLDAELRLRSCGEVGGFFNIMVYEELRDRCMKNACTESILSQSTNLSSSYYQVTPSKKRSCKQIPEGPMKIALVGNTIRLNEISSTRVPFQRDSPTPTSTRTSESSFKPDCVRKQNRIGLLPKIRSFKSNSSSPFSVLKNEQKSVNKSTQANTPSKRRLTVGKIIPPKFEITTTTKSSWQQEQSWTKI